MLDLAKITGFDWDLSNRDKILARHTVRPEEAEEVFADENALFLKDVVHSQNEMRFQVLGQTKVGRRLTVVFTLRGHDTLIRVISACDMDRRERGCYD